MFSNFLGGLGENIMRRGQIYSYEDIQEQMDCECLIVTLLFSICVFKSAALGSVLQHFL